MNLYLIGYRGVGKTTVARLLAQALRRPWCDADAVLEERAGMTIRDIFAREGEAGFRTREADALRHLGQAEDRVVATGGGVVLREENRELLRRGRIVWLTAAPDVIWRRLQADETTGERRPNLARGGLAEIEELLAVRTPLYEACADLRIDTDARTPEEVAALVVAWWSDKNKGMTLESRL